jgi:hypothetical protein
MARLVRSASLVMVVSVMVLMTLAVLNFGVVARAATPQGPQVSPSCTSVDDQTSSHRPFRGYCRCGCSFTPDCNTSADCGGGICSKAPSCC